MKKLSAYDIWYGIRKRIESQIVHKKEVIINYTEQLIDDQNRIHREESELTLLENNLQIAKGRLSVLPNPEPKE